MTIKTMKLFQLLICICLSGRVVASFDEVKGDNIVGGYGTIEFKDGRVHEGELAGGKVQVVRSLKLPDGHVYKGEVKDGRAHGKGNVTYADGDRYEGDFKGGKRHGKGIMKHVNGDIYDGEWKDNKRHGHGEYNHANGTIYKGEWMSDKFQGESKVTTEWTFVIYLLLGIASASCQSAPSCLKKKGALWQEAEAIPSNK